MGGVDHYRVIYQLKNLAPPAKFQCKGNQRSHMATFCSGGVILAKLNNEQPSFMWDTGANRSETSSKTILENVIPCEPITIQGAFGPAVIPSLKGELGPLKLPCENVDCPYIEILLVVPNFLIGI